MRAAVFAGGPSVDTGRAGQIASSCDVIYAADSGADTAIASGLIPDKLFGDMDSVSPETLLFLKEKGVDTEVFPVEKDMTDSEICVRALPEDSEIILIGSFAGRPDHMMSNIMMAVKLHSEGRDITLTDGVSDFIPLCGPDEIRISGIQEPEGLKISIIPFSEVKGVTTEGLYYELKDASLNPGSSFSVSNKIKDGSDSFFIGIEEGKAGVVITPL